jgi:hypothetical protein
LAEDAPFDVLQIGPGGSFDAALTAHALGARRCWLVEVGRGATTEGPDYREMARFLADAGLAPVDVEACDSLDSLLSACDASYHAGGLAAMCELPACSIDLVFSNSVLHTLPRDELFELMCETRRVLRP